MLSLLLTTALAQAVEIPHETYVLENGLRVVLIEDHSVPQVVVDTWYGVGSYDDPNGASGFAHLFEHLMFMGTERIPIGEFDSRMEAAGGWNNASTAANYTNYYDVGPSELLELLLYMEADRMTGLDITQEKLDTQREVVRNERRQNYEDSPYGKIWLELPEMMYPENHPYSLEGIGSHEDLLNATLDTVTNFYADWYVPNNATLCVAGDFDPVMVKPIIEDWFGQLSPSKAVTHYQAPEVSTPQLRAKTVTDNVQLPAVVMVWHSPKIFAPGDAELDILADVLAGGPDSRLTASLVHEQQLVQDLGIFQYSRKDGSMFIAMAYATPGADLGLIQSEIEKELAAIGSGEKPLTSRELKQALSSFEVGTIWGLESNLERAEALQSFQFYTGTTDYLEESIQRYRLIDSTKVQHTVSQLLSAEKSAVLTVLPKESEQPAAEEPANQSSEGGDQ